MKVKTQVKAKVTNGDFKSLRIDDLVFIYVDEDRAYFNEISIPKSIAEEIIDSIKADSQRTLRLIYIEYEADLTLEVEDFGLRVTQGGREIFAIVLRGDRAVLLTPKVDYEIEHAESLRESLRHGVTAYVR